MYPELSEPATRAAHPAQMNVTNAPAQRCFPHFKLLVSGNVPQTNELPLFSVAPHFVYRIVIFRGGEAKNRGSRGRGRKCKTKLAQRDESEISKDGNLRGERAERSVSQRLRSRGSRSASLLSTRRSSSQQRPSTREPNNLAPALFPIC